MNQKPSVVQILNSVPQVLTSDSGMGSIGVQIAKSEGITDITGVDLAEKVEMMRAAGYGKTIDYKSEDFTRSGQHYDQILDAKTNRSVFDYVRALKPGGTYVTVGGDTGKLLQVFLFGPIIRRRTKKTISVVALKPNKDMALINDLY